MLGHLVESFVMCLEDINLCMKTLKNTTKVH